MNKQEKLQLHDDIQKYLERNDVYGVVQNMIQQLLIQQPKEPLDFMINHLSKPTKNVILLIGPPGMRLYRLAQNAIHQYHNPSQCIAFNCGQFVLRLESSLPPEDKKLLKECRLIKDKNTVDKVLDQIKNIHSSGEDCLIEGYPKSLEQALRFEEINLHPSKVIFVNMDPNNLRELCSSKIKEKADGLSEQKINQLTQQAIDEYQMNMRNLKQYYPTYLEIDGTANREDSQVTQQIHRCLGLELKTNKPRKNTQIVIMGAPKSGRTTLGNSIALKYNLAYVSTAVLIAEQIRRDTVTGRKIKQNYLSNTLVDDFTIEKLIDQRISKKDCQMQGFVVEGYPKTTSQWENLKNMRVKPNFIIGIDASEELLQNRFPQAKDLTERYKKWTAFKSSIEKEKSVFWLNPTLNADNAFEQVCFEIENRKSM